MSAIGVAYTSSTGGSYNITFDQFSEVELARTYSETTEFQRGVSGTQLITGRPGRSKYIFAIAAYVDETTARELDDMFQAWDVDRGKGLAAAVGVIDETGFKTENTSAVFTTPPSYAKAGPNYYAVSFGLTEV